MSEQEQERERVTMEAGQRSVVRDRTLAGLDATDLRDRMLQSFEEFISKGFEVHLIGLEVRDETVYRLELEADGHGPVDMRELTEIADQRRLDIYVDKTSEGKLGIVLYART